VERNAKMSTTKKKKEKNESESDICTRRSSFNEEEKIRMFFYVKIELMP